MNVKSVAQLATKVMAKANSLPKLAKTGIKIGAIGLVFGGGMLAEKAIIGDKFEKVNARLDALEQSNPNNENVKALENSKVKEKTKGKKEKVKSKEENQVKLIKPKNYIEPELSEHGKIDTSYYDATKIPCFISYKDKPAGKDEGELRTVREEAYEKDGKMLSYIVYDWSHVPTSGYYEGRPSTITYDFDGSIISSDEYYNFGKKYSLIYRGGLNKDTWEYDSEGRETRYKKLDYDKVFYSQDVRYNPDGSATAKFHATDKEEIQKWDKNGKVLERKLFGKNGILQYTITPQYDKDGALIKNDTVWNK